MALAQEVVTAAWEGARARFEELGVDCAALLEVSVARTLARFERARRAPDEISFRSALGRAALEDLGLVIAWERGDQRAWSLYESEYRNTVIASAQRQGAPPAAAEELADELPGALLAAAVEGGTSPLARYDGSGSLRGWLCTIARRRVVDAARRVRRSEELEEVEHASAHTGPQVDAEESELVQRMRTTADSLRDTLSPRERLVLLLKHEQGLPQRAIAVRLGLSDSRVTRLVQHATEKVREHLVRDLGDELPEGSALPTELLRVLGSPASRRDRVAAPDPLPPSEEPS